MSDAQGTSATPPDRETTGASPLRSNDESSSSLSSSPSPPSIDQNSDSEPRRPRRPRPKHDFPETQAGKLWKALSNPSGGPVNELPGGTFNSAGGKPKDLRWTDAFRFDQFNRPDRPSFYQTTCARDSLLVGIAAGGGVGGLRFILKGLSGTLVTTNWAVGFFTLTSASMYYWCEQRRREEAKGMAVAMAGMKMLHEKRAKEEADQKKLQDETRQIQEVERQKNKRWYKWW